MSISGTSNYMSNADILAWMEVKTEDLYGHMRDSMDVANTRADAESALDDIKAAITNSKQNGGNADAAHQAITDALAKYKDVPEVAEVLQPIMTQLDDRYQQRANAVAEANAQAASSGMFDAMVSSAEQAPVTMTSDDVDAWTKQIGDKVDALGKQDQLGMINIQEFNSQLNQAKQTASALMDSADKSTSAIINHIS